MSGSEVWVIRDEHSTWEYLIERLSPPSLLPEGTWNRFELRVTDSEDSIALFVNDALVGIGFHSSPPQGLLELGFRICPAEGPSTEVVFDDFELVAP